MNTQHLNHFADSMFGIEKTPADADAEVTRYTAHRALPLPAEPMRKMVQLGGRDAWPARRHSPEMAAEWEVLDARRSVPPRFIDRLPEDYDEDQSESADADVLLWLLKGLCIVLLAMFSAWCIASYLELAHV